MRIASFLPPLAAVALAGCVTGCLGGCHKQKPPPSIDGLSDALKRSAEKALAAPSLADEQIIVPANPGHTDTQTAEIKHAFTDAGGVGISSVDPQGRISIMADIPTVNVAPFKAELQHQPATMQQAAASPTRLIEVLIEPTPTPSPQP